MDVANNIPNLLIDPDAQQFSPYHEPDPLQVIEQSPNSGHGNGGLGYARRFRADDLERLALRRAGNKTKTQL